jgi:hypothetical protein
LERDSLLFDPNQKENTTCITSGGDCPNGSDADFILGPSYFDGLQSFANYSMTFQAPLTYPINKSNILEYVNRAYTALGSDRVDAIALGNEVAYHGHDKKPEEYVSDAGIMIEYISESLNLTGEDARIFQVLDMGSSTVDSGSPYTLYVSSELLPCLFVLTSILDTTPLKLVSMTIVPSSMLLSISTNSVVEWILLKQVFI